MLKVVENTLLNSRDTARKLRISYDTLRKYNSIFYEVGHTFLKEKNQIVYRSVDILMLQEFLKLKKETKYSVKECADIVVNGKTSQLGNQPSQQTRNLQEDPIIQNLMERMGQQEQAMKTQGQELRNLKEYINTKLEERDRQLMSFVRDMQEAKKEIAASKEKKWWQFWK